MLSVLRRLRRVPQSAARRTVGSITHVITSAPAVALTFDDGPNPAFTPRLLDLLERHGAHATFFMIGTAAQHQPDLVRRVAQGGHAIGNHTWDHPCLPLIDGRERRDQIVRGREALAPYGQHLFRPPYGYQDVASHLDALRFGYQVIAYSAVAMDFLDHDAGWMVEHLECELRPGSILAFHDALHSFQDVRYTDREPTFETVALLLERWGHRFRFLSVVELLRVGRPQREHWYRQPNVAYLNRLQTPEGKARSYAVKAALAK